MMQETSDRTSRIRLLLYSPNQTTKTLLDAALSGRYRLRCESQAQRVHHLAASSEVDVLIIDLDRNKQSADDAAALLSNLELLDVPVVLMADDDTRTTAVNLLQYGVYDYFRKPPHLGELQIIIRRAYECSRLRKELQSTQRTLRTLSRREFARSMGAQTAKITSLIDRVAHLDNFVLITGESGTGKEVVARTIHEMSRKRFPFVAVPCGAIPETLMEAELFGCERGAFTGAESRKEGYFERAGKGTLLLDELAELTPSTQVKLLRVLQEREFKPLGGKTPIRLEARVLFATHRDLATMVQDGSFRQDLFFRINVIQIGLPPLRERREEIPVLANHFLRCFAKAFQKPVLRLSEGAVEFLLAYDWPGNVRELENAVQRAVILTEGPIVGVEHFSITALDYGRLCGPAAMNGRNFEDRINYYKFQLVEKAVQESRGNKAEAARRLGITRAYLHRLLHRAELASSET